MGGPVQPVQPAGPGRGGVRGGGGGELLQELHLLGRGLRGDDGHGECGAV